MEVTTIKVSRETLKMLEQLRRSMNEKSLDAVIRRLIYERRMDLLDKIYGMDRGKIGEFVEEDRFEGRY